MPYGQKNSFDCMLSAITKGRDTGSEMVRCLVFLFSYLNHIVEKAYFCYNKNNWGLCRQLRMKSNTAGLTGGTIWEQ